LDILSAVQRPYTAGSRLGDWIERRVPSVPGKSRFLGLQPIFNRQGDIFAYEALSRSTYNNRFTGDSRHATYGIVTDWLLDDLDRLTAGKPVFLNCTREDLAGDLMALLPVRIVVEVLETVLVDEWVVDACRRLKAFGHDIALDDFQLAADDSGLLALADYVKIDFQLFGKDQRKEMVEYLAKKAIRLIAEKIETREQFRSALEEGFHLFQGYYLARPVLLSKGTIRSRWLNYLRLRWLSRKRRSRWR
jgi:EAL and modified HD-GYP domain-containing signal transduction protein